MQSLIGEVACFLGQTSKVGHGLQRVIASTLARVLNRHRRDKSSSLGPQTLYQIQNSNYYPTEKWAGVLKMPLELVADESMHSS